MTRILWHLWRHGHTVRVTRGLSVGMHDLGAKGWLYRCECGRTWAR